MKQPIVAQSAPQKPYHPSPVQDSKRCGFGGLLSRLAVHAANRDEEDNSSSEMEPMAREGVVLVRLSERSDLPFIGAREGGEQAAAGGEAMEGDETNRQHAKRCAPFVRIHAPLQQNVSVPV